MHATPLTCSQCGGPRTKVDHHCPYCRTEYPADTVIEDDYDDWEDFEEELHRQMDVEDALFKEASRYQFGWTDTRNAYGTVHVEPVIPASKEINWGAVFIGAGLGVWALYLVFGW